MPRVAKNFAEFDEDTLDRLVKDSLARIKKMKAILESDGYVIQTESTVKTHPLLAAIISEQKWVQGAWTAKYPPKRNSDGPKNKFDKPVLEE